MSCIYHKNNRVLTLFKYILTISPKILNQNRTVLAIYCEEPCCLTASVCLASEREPLHKPRDSQRRNPPQNGSTLSSSRHQTQSLTSPL